MKKKLIFSVFTMLISSFSAIFADSFATSFFDSNIEYRLNREDLATEFKDWSLVANQSMKDVFSQEMAFSDELRKMYYYFRGPINRMYDTGIFSDTMTHQTCVECIRCNVDILIDIFRKSLIKHAQEIETQAQNVTIIEIPTQLDVTMQVPEQIAFQMLEDELTTPISSTTQISVNTSEPDFSESDLDDEDDEYDPILESYYEHIDEHKQLSEEKVEEELGILSAEPTFKERLEAAIMRLSDNHDSARQRFIALAKTLMYAENDANVSSDKLIALNEEINEFVNERMMPEKQWEEYTWKEKIGIRSPFAKIKERVRKNIFRQRVLDADRPYISVALNIQNVLCECLVKRHRDNHNYHEMRNYYQEQKRALRLVLDLA